MGTEIQDTILVSVDFTNGKDLSVMVVGRKRPNQTVEIINALQGKETVQTRQTLNKVVRTCVERKHYRIFESLSKRKRLCDN